MPNNTKQHIFFLTYDLQLGFYKRLQVINTTKLYDYEHMRFYDYDKTDNPFLSSFHPEQEYVQTILTVITNHDYSIMLKPDDMQWYKEVSQLYKEDKELVINQREIFYNFLILKCKLCGFSDDFSIAFIRHLFNLQKTEKIDLSITVQKLDEIIDTKKIWVPYIIYEDCLIEKDFLVKAVKKRIDEAFDFNFDNSFGKEYIAICNNSFVKHTYEYNKTPNFFHDNGLSFDEQYKILLHLYENFTIKNVQEVCAYESKWERFASDRNVMMRFIESMMNTLKLTMKAWR